VDITTGSADMADSMVADATAVAITKEHLA